MDEEAKVGRRDDEPTTVSLGSAFSYCCECGTYDAHATSCTCCGFDFRALGAINESNGT